MLSIDHPPQKQDLKPIVGFKLILKKLHNHLYGGGPIKTEDRLAREIARLVLCKIVDELSDEDTLNFYATDKELSSNEGRESIYQRVLNLSVKINHSKSHEYELGAYWVAEVVKELQLYSLTDFRSYTSPLADVYEIFNSGQFKGGRGQFFTPPVVINLALSLLNITSDDVVCDPACGSGNFISKILTQFASSKLLRENARSSNVTKNIYAQDIEADLIEIAKDYSSIIADENLPNLFTGDSLDIRDSKLPLNRFTKIFTNPPFGTNIQVTNSQILDLYDLGHHLSDGIPTKQISRGQHPERLFIELCVKLLKKDGIAAIVIPRQTLSGNESNAIEVRRWLLKNVTVLGVIDLPPDTFQPYTGTITSLLILKKQSSTKDHKVFFSICENVGHDRRGLPLLQLDSEGNSIDMDGRDILMDDTLVIIKKWEEFASTGELHDENHFGFLVDTNTIMKNKYFALNAWAYNPDANEAYRQVMLLEEDDYDIALLKDLCIDIFVPTRHKRKYVEPSNTSIAFLSTTQIFQIHDIDYKFQPYSFAEASNLTIEEGWILVTRSGSTGRVRYVNSELAQYSVSDHCIRIIPDSEKVDSGYLYAFLSSIIGQRLIDQGRYASVIETISHTRLGEIPVPIPNKQKQKEIGDIIRQSEQLRVQANQLRNSAISLLDI